MSTPLPFNTGANGYCVARPNGKYCVIFPNHHILTESGIIPLPNAGNLLWLDLSANGKIAGTANDNKAYERGEFSWSTGINCYAVPRCCIYLNNNLLRTVQTASETGALGYIQVSDSGQLVKTIDHYADTTRGIYEYIIRGNVTVGHGGESNLGQNPLICIIDNKTYLLEKGNCLAIKFYRDGDNCAIAWINDSVSKVWFTTVLELKTFPIYDSEQPEPPEPPVMGLPVKVNNLWKTWNQKFQLPTGEANIRAFTIRFCEQTAFTFPNEGWGTKSADPNRPVSKDTVTQITPPSAVNSPRPNDVKTGMKSWDLIQGSGTSNPVPIYANQTEHNTTTQWFHKVVPTNYLGTTPPEPPEPPSTNPDRDMLIHIRDEINEYLQDT